MMNDNAYVIITDELILGDGTSVVTVKVGTKTEKYTVSTRLFRENGFMTDTRLSFDCLEQLEMLQDLTKAIKKGLGLLSYSDSSKYSLTRKLLTKGFDRDISELAASQLEKMGYIKEEDHALRLARSLAKQLYGPVAIAERLKGKGFEKKYVKTALETVSEETDFTENLRIYSEKTGLYEGIVSPSDMTQYKKVCAKILRRGYSFEHISQLKAQK